MRGLLTQAQHQIYEAGWRADARFRVAVCGRRFGKALALDTKLPGPAGWTSMRAIRAGDELFDELGAACRVVATGPILQGRPCYRVDFDDGCSIVCDVEHLWPIVQYSGTDVVGGVVELGDMIRRMSRGERVLVPAAAGVGQWDAAAPYVRDDPALHLPVAYKLARIAAELRRDGELADEGVVMPGARPAFAALARSCGLLPRVVQGKTVLPSTAEAHLAREVVRIVAVASVPVRCIQVDSQSSQYLCGDGYIPTHNTFLIGEELRRAARLAVQRRVPAENEIWYGAPNFLQAKRVMWSRLKAAIPPGWQLARPNESDCSIRLVTGHKIRLVGLDAHDNLRGSGLWFFAGDEWADVRPEAWAQTLRPMLSTSSGHALFVGTPKGHNHFHELYQSGMEGGEDDHRSFRFTTAQGGRVPAEELAAARRLLDERTYRQEYEAAFESFSGRVLYGFCRDASVRAPPPAAPGETPVWHVGMDFNVNPMTATIWRVTGTLLWQVDEIVLPTSNTDEIVAVLRAKYVRQSGFSGASPAARIVVYPDPAGQQRRSSAGGRTDVSILREAGFEVQVLAAHPSVRDRVNVMNRMFAASDGTRSAFVAPNCRKSIEAYENLRYREGTGDVDKTTGHDHLADATGYFLYWWGTRREIAPRAAPYLIGR